MKKIIPLKKKENLSPFFIIANLFSVIILFLLPYYLFEGRLFLGGDDTRFYYAYPKEVLNSLALYSWNNISSLPYYIPNHYWLPFLVVVSMLEELFVSKVYLFYFLFSLLQVLGFIFFQKFIREVIGKENIISFISALIYILSPITITTLSFFLSPIWSIALAPIVGYYFVRYIQFGNNKDLIKVTIWSFFLSFVYYSIPWILGFVFPLICGLIFLIIFVDNPLKKFLKRTIIFCFIIISSQLFWILSFIGSITTRGSISLGEKIVSKSLSESFKDTIVTTASDNIIYPLLTFYHRQIAFDFEWQLMHIFSNYFDQVLLLGIIFILVLFLGFVKYNQSLNKNEKKIFIFFSVSFIVVLYFFTVNIGFLKDLFLLFGNIPGFVVFRNFTDKFAISYVFFYSTLLALCFYIIKKSYKFYNLILLVSIIVILINFLPVKQIVNSPLWKTKNIYTSANLPEEYLSFTKNVELSIPDTANIISFPQNLAAYSIITEENTKNAYVGTSPFKFFTGINDLTGSGSYSEYISSEIQRLIIKEDYEGLLELLSQINTGYVMVTNNVPQEVKNSYLYERKYLKLQNEKLIKSISDKEIIRSTKSNYVIYKLKNSPSVIESDANLSYRKISPIHYELIVKGLNSNKNLRFQETYHPGWKLYLSKSSDKKAKDFFYEVSFLFKKPIFNSSHDFINPYGNQWTIAPQEIKIKLDESNYKTNKDGSVDITLDLYFLPQMYFYLGVVLTVTFLSVGALYFFVEKKNETNKKDN